MATTKPSKLTPADAVPLRAEQRAAAIEALTYSLVDDPLNVHFLPSGADRVRVLPVLMRTLLSYAVRRGYVNTTADTAGVTMFLPPGECHVSTWGMLRAGMARVALRAGLSGFGRLLRAGQWLEQLRFRHASEPHWYMLGQGVHPDHQRRGVAAALIQNALDYADADGKPCHAETFSLQNAHYYERFGLKAIAEADLPGGGPHVWVLARRVGG